MASLDYFVGQDTTGNPITETYNLSHDDRLKAKMQEMAQMYDWNKMSYQNWYNSADQQVQRLQDAGLNPLYYLGGNAGTTQAGSGGSAGMANATGTDSRLSQLQEAVNAASNSLLGGANTLLQSQKQAQDFEIANRELRIRNKELGLEERRLNQDIKASNQNIAESQTRVEKLGQEIVNLGKEALLTDELITVAKNNAAYILQMIAESTERINTEKTQQFLNKANANKASAEADTINALRDTQVKLALETLNVTKEEAKKIQKEVEAIMTNTDKAKAEKEAIELLNRLIKRYGDAEKVVGLLNGLTSSWNNLWQGTKAGVDAAATIVDHTPQGAAIGAVNKFTKPRSNTHSNPTPKKK